MNKAEYQAHAKEQAHAAAIAVAASKRNLMRGMPPHFAVSEKEHCEELQKRVVFYTALSEGRRPDIIPASCVFNSKDLINGCL